MVPAKKKGFFTYAEEMPSLYKKISLTFDYWVPKILDWTQEIRKTDLVFRFNLSKITLIFLNEKSVSYLRNLI